MQFQIGSASLTLGIEKLDRIRGLRRDGAQAGQTSSRSPLMPTGSWPSCSGPTASRRVRPRRRHRERRGPVLHRQRRARDPAAAPHRAGADRDRGPDARPPFKPADPRRPAATASPAKLGPLAAAVEDIGVKATFSSRTTAPATSGRSTSRSASSRRTASGCRSTPASSRAAATCSSTPTRGEYAGALELTFAGLPQPQGDRAHHHARCRTARRASRC